MKKICMIMCVTLLFSVVNAVAAKDNSGYVFHNNSLTCLKNAETPAFLIKAEYTEKNMLTDIAVEKINMSIGETIAVDELEETEKMFLLSSFSEMIPLAKAHSTDNTPKKAGGGYMAF